MDVAYPVGGRRLRPDVLKYSLRALWQHLGHERVYVVGEIPGWLNLDMVTAVRVEQSSTKWHNIGRNVQAVLDTDISEDFYWFNDDFILLEDMDEIPLYNRGRFSEWATARAGKVDKRSADIAYIPGMMSQWEVAKAWGYADPLNVDVHVPMPTNKTRLKGVVDRMVTDHPEHPLGHFRTLYGLGLESERLEDPRIGDVDRGIPQGWKYVAVAPTSWKGRLGEQIRGRYWRACPYESKGAA